MKNLIRVAQRTYLKDLKNYMTYKFNIFGELFLNFILVFMLFYAANVFKNSESLLLEKYDNNYFLFLLTGMMVFLFLTKTFSSIIFFVNSSQNLGYLESFFLTRTNFVIILISSSIFPITQAFLRMIIIFLFSFIFDPNSLNIIQLPEVLLLLLLLAVPFIGISLIVAAFNLVFKRANFVSSIFLIGCAVFSGIIYPIAVLPSYLQNLSIFFPSTFAVNIIRGRLIEDLSYVDMLQPLITIIFLAIANLIFGIFAIKYAINKAKRDGSIGHY